MIAQVPSSSGPPTSANSKNPNGLPAASWAASLTITLTGVPVRVSSDPACAAKASGSRSCETGIRARLATTTTIGSRAATAPLMLMNAVTAATSRQITVSSGPRRVPPG